MAEKIRITKRSKIGWNYNCDASHYDTIGIPYPDKPYYIGTINQVLKSIREDRTYKSIRSGGTYYSECFFAKLRGNWVKIRFGDIDYDLDWLLDGQVIEIYATIIN